MSFCESLGRAAINTRFRSTAAVIGALVLSAFAVTESWAQSTVVIGGSGQPAVEVNLDVLDRTDGQFSGVGRRLLMPGERPAEVIRLRAPGSSGKTPSVASAPRLKLRPPAIRPVRQAAKPMPASPAPMVTQRAVSAPTPTQRVARATPLISSSRPTRVAPPPQVTPPPMAEKPASPSSKTMSPQQTAAKSALQKPTPPPPVAKAPPPPVAKSPPPPPPPVAKAPPPPPIAKVPTPPVAKVPPPPPPAAAPAAPPLPRAPPTRTAKAQPQAVQTARAPARPSPPATQSRGEEPKVAVLPRVSLPRDGGQVLRIDFLGASTRLTSDAERSLGSLAATMGESDGRLQLKAYAGGTGETLSSARRLSLSRALAVRSFLIEQGIRSTRIDVRALGRAEDSGPPERVDVVLLTQ